MSRTLADILGWEEGAVYRCNNKFFKIKHGLLVSSLTGKQNSWHVDWSVEVNSIFYLKKAIKVEPKRYYLKHKYLREEGTNYLGLNTYYNYLDVEYPDEGEFRKTQFTEDEIENLEASGFDLRNFERVEVEND
mgnify:CR=1 FL=1